MAYVNNHTFIKAIKFIYQNLDYPITIELIAKNIGVSVSTLKRLFVDATELSVGSFVRRLRMERAFRSLKDKEDSILEIALSSGFEDASAFARSFKENFGYSPTFARNKVNIISELECVSLEEPEIIQIEKFKIQAVTKQGLYFESAPVAWKALKKHLNEMILSDDFTGTFIAIGHDNPHDPGINEDKVRFSSGVVYETHDLKIEHLTITGGAYAKFNYIGKLNNIGLAYHYIYGAWLNKSSSRIDCINSAFMMMDKFPNNFKESNVSIYVPLII